eukprot:COSAG01_NODE_1706_length_9427_cov_51.196934_9_plen_45_part_00
MHAVTVCNVLYILLGYVYFHQLTDPRLHAWGTRTAIPDTLVTPY